MRKQLDGARVGALVGAVGGLLFVLLDLDATPSDFRAYVAGLGVLLFALVVWLVWRVPPDPDAYEPDAQQVQTFWIVVGLEVVAIVAGTQVAIRVLGRPELSLPWVAVVLGLHWLAFHLVFQRLVFLYLGWFTLTLGVLGFVTALSQMALAAQILCSYGVAAVLFGCIGVDALRHRSEVLRRRLRTATKRPPGRNRSR